MATDQEKFWQASFGDSYTQRNRTAEVGSLRSNVALFSRILASTSGVESVIEFGAGDGRNLHAINKVMPFIQLSAVEINEQAAEAMPDCVTTILHASILDEIQLAPQDMVLCKGLAIHVAPDDLPKLYANLYKASKKYIVLAEYFSTKIEEIEYRGHAGRLWKGPHAYQMMDAYPDLKLHDYGFVSRRDQNPQDDLNWWTLEKLK